MVEIFLGVTYPTKEVPPKRKNPFKSDKPLPVAAKPQAGLGESRIYMMRAVSETGLKPKSRFLCIELECGPSVLEERVAKCGKPFSFKSFVFFNNRSLAFVRDNWFSPFNKSKWKALVCDSRVSTLCGCWVVGLLGLGGPTYEV